MTVLRCRRFPRGTVHIRTAGGVVVDFHDGRAEVNDPELVAALLAVPPVFGIEADEPPVPQASPEPSRGDARWTCEQADKCVLDRSCGNWRSCGQSGDERPAPPPARGPGSSRDAWATYAQWFGVTVPDGLKAAAIRGLLAERGIPTE